MSGVVLKSKSGIGGATTQTGVPMQWSQSWFQGFVNNQLRGADVRNAVGAGGIVVSGNITTPYATISLGPTVPASLTFTGNDTFAPASGSPTTIDTPLTGPNAAIIDLLQGMSSGGAYEQFNDDHTGTPVAEGYIGYGPALFTGAAASTFGIASQNGILELAVAGGATPAMTFAASTGVATFSQSTPVFQGGTTGAGTATFVSTNKPGTSGTSPSTWLPVNVAGATHYIPCWL
jgi:hypothetical protein